METLREKFLRAFTNIPLNARNETILVLDGRPMSWNVAFIEVKAETKTAPIILEKLEEMKII